MYNLNEIGYISYIQQPRQRYIGGSFDYVGDVLIYNPYNQMISFIPDCYYWPAANPIYGNTIDQIHIAVIVNPGTYYPGKYAKCVVLDGGESHPADISSDACYAPTREKIRCIYEEIYKR